MSTIAESITEFLTDADPRVVSVAEEIKTIDENLANGSIDADMHKELIENALELVKVGSYAQTLETKIQVEKMTDAVLMILKVL